MDQGNELGILRSLEFCEELSNGTQVALKRLRNLVLGDKYQ